MNFVSDNCYGASREILSAVASIGQSPQPAYGDDDVTQSLTTRFGEIFERDVAVFPVISGTAANALALAALAPPHGAILCHAEAHIAVDECGAPEFFTHGAKLVPIDAHDAKLTTQAIEMTLGSFHKGNVHQSQPSAISITQATELGSVYTQAEIGEIAALAHARGMKLHMDGARFANSLVSLGCSPAELTWKCGVDALSFGATKNGALAADMVVFFDPSDAADFKYRRKKSGHLLSKMRFISVQLEAYLADGHWLANARRANMLARQLAAGLAQLPDVEIVHPVSSNAVFASMPVELVARLRKSGASFFDWGTPAAGRIRVRLMLSFATPENAVAQLIEIARAR